MKPTHLKTFSGIKIMDGQKTKSKGFTLIEIIIVLVIIGIISVFAAPRIYDNYVSNRITAAAKQILADIRFAQSLAMMGHDSTWVVFDDDENLYKLYSGATKAARTLVEKSSGDGSYIRQLDQGEYKNVTITGLSIGNDKSIAFDWSGNTNNSGSIILNNTVTVTVAMGTGMVRIEGW